MICGRTSWWTWKTLRRMKRRKLICGWKAHWKTYERVRGYPVAEARDPGGDSIWSSGNSSSKESKVIGAKHLKNLNQPTLEHKSDSDSWLKWPVPCTEGTTPLLLAALLWNRSNNVGRRSQWSCLVLIPGPVIPWRIQISLRLNTKTKGTGLAPWFERSTSCRIFKWGYPHRRNQSKQSTLRIANVLESTTTRNYW
jgi:hypothetical protein